MKTKISKPDTKVHNYLQFFANISYVKMKFSHSILFNKQL